jgi:hypothetical protein
MDLLLEQHLLQSAAAKSPKAANAHETATTVLMEVFIEVPPFTLSV